MFILLFVFLSHYVSMTKSKQCALCAAVTIHHMMFWKEILFKYLSFFFVVVFLDCFKTTWNENLLYVLLLSLSLVCILSVFPLLSQARGENTFFFRNKKNNVTVVVSRYQTKNVCQASYWFYCFVSDFILSISNDHKIEYCFYVASVIHKLFTSPTYLLILNDSSSLL